MLATGGDDTFVRVFKLSNGFREHKKIMEFKASEQAVKNLDISRNNRYLIVATGDSTAHIYDLENNGNKL